MKTSDCLRAVIGALAAGIVTGAAVQDRQVIPGKDIIGAPGENRDQLFRPIDAGHIACSMVNVRQSMISERITTAIEDESLDRAFTKRGISSDVYETDFVYYGKVHYSVKWVPSKTFSISSCPEGTPGRLFKAMFNEYQETCSNLVQLGAYEFPNHMKQDYNNCGILEVFQSDSLSGYNDVLARPGFLVCGGRDKLFSTNDIKPLIRSFCKDFGKKTGAVGGYSKMLRKHSNIKYEPGPFQQLSHDIDVVRTSCLNIFAAFDEDACTSASAEARWPSEEECIEHLESAMNASGNVGMCSRECSLTNDRDDIFQLEYCQEFHEPTIDKTNGGYTWANCFRWGVVDDLKEGVLGAIIGGQKEE